MKEYFVLQNKLINRRFKETGIEPWLSYLLIFLGFIFVSFLLFQRTKYAEYIYVFLSLNLISKLSEPTRNEFLEIAFNKSKLKKIRLIENLLIALPFLSFLLYKQLFISFSILLVLSVILAFYTIKIRSSRSIWTPFSKWPFEFSTGFRSSLGWLILVYFLTFMAVYYDNFNLSIFGLIALFFLIIGFYSKAENEYYVWTYSNNSNEFLLGKIKHALLFSAFLSLPILISQLIFFPDNAVFTFVTVLISWAFLIALLLSKYSIYPNEMGILQGIPIAISVWFPPLLLLLIPFLYKKSENQLSKILK